MVGYLRTPNPIATDGTTAWVTPAPTSSVSAPPDPDRALGIVWVSIPTKIYHYLGHRWFGTTRNGKYMQEQDAVAEGDRPALNERRAAFFDRR